jgi:hypothetical protein
MSLRKVRAELNKLKRAAKKPLPNGGMLLVNVDRGETREQVAARYGLDPDTEGLIFIPWNDRLEGLC